MCSGGVSESSRICLQSLKSRLCGEDRWLPLLAFVERRQGQVQIYMSQIPDMHAEDPFSYMYSTYLFSCMCPEEFKCGFEIRIIQYLQVWVIAIDGYLILKA